jgi:hypothetical protein
MCHIVELCTLNRQLSDIDVGMKNKTNAIHTTLTIITKIWRPIAESKKKVETKRCITGRIYRNQRRCIREYCSKNRMIKDEKA